MTEKLKKINDMLHSSDSEMKRLGILTAITTCSYEECKQIIPFYHRFSSMEIREPIAFISSLVPEYRTISNTEVYPKNHLYIKNDFAIAIYDNRVFCRRLGTMEMLCDFEDIDKSYF